jgi:TPR repeat protein
MRRAQPRGARVVVAGFALAGLFGCGGSVPDRSTQIWLDLGQRACFQQSLAGMCVGLGDHYLGLSAEAMTSQWTAPLDPVKAKEAYVAGCSHGDAQACSRLLALHLLDGDASQKQAAEAKVAASPYSDGGQTLAHDLAYNRARAVKLEAMNREADERRAAEEAAQPSTLQMASVMASVQARSLKIQARAGGRAAAGLDEASRVSGKVSELAQDLDRAVPAAATARTRLHEAYAVEVPDIPMPRAALDEQAGDALYTSNVYYCTSGVARACVAIGLDYEEGSSGLPKDVARATAVYDAVCQAYPRAGCWELGVRIYARGKFPVRRDRDKALTALRRGCEAKADNACKEIAGVEASSPVNGPVIPPGLADDPACLAQPVCAGMADFCRQGNADQCSGLAFAYQEGRWVPRDLAHAKRLLELLCTDAFADASSCISLSQIYAHDSTPHDTVRAKEALTRACRRGGVCGVLAATDPAIVVSICDEKNLPACRDLLSTPSLRAHVCTTLGAMCSAGDAKACDTRAFKRGNGLPVCGP